MLILVILAHPNKLSFNHAIANSAIDALKAIGHRVILHDLYEEKFDPLLRYGEIPESCEIDEVVRGKMGMLMAHQ